MKENRYQVISPSGILASSATNSSHLNYYGDVSSIRIQSTSHVKNMETALANKIPSFVFYPKAADQEIHAVAMSRIERVMGKFQQKPMIQRLITLYQVPICIDLFVFPQIISLPHFIALPLLLISPQYLDPIVLALFQLLQLLTVTEGIKGLEERRARQKLGSFTSSSRGIPLSNITNTVDSSRSCRETLAKRKSFLAEVRLGKM
ncbi:hypothetical protein OROGR_009288 [Orobanche gracilis]